MLPQNHVVQSFIIKNPEDDLYFCDYSFDYENKCFNANKVNGLDALIEWVNKALDTPKERYIIYSHQYGLPIEKLIAEHLPPDVFKSELKRMIKECLLIHPVIMDVTDYTFRQEKDMVFVTFTVMTSLGDFESVVSY